MEWTVLIWWHIYTFMKRMPREECPDMLSKGSSNERLMCRVDTLSKSFRKKYHPAEPSTVSSSSNLTKTFSKTQTKPHLPAANSPSKPSQRRSHSRNGHTRTTDKISLVSQAYHQSHGLPTATKLLQICSIFSKSAWGGAFQALGQLYQQNDQYLQLLFEWQKVEIYDQVDKLVYQLTQLFVSRIESIIKQTYSQLDAKLQSYEKAIHELELQNRRMQMQKQASKESDDYFRQLQDRLNQQFHKNQWSNAILQHIRTDQFDLEAFVRRMPLYRYVAYGDEFMESEQQRLEVARGETEDKKITKRSQGNVVVKQKLSGIASSINHNSKKERRRQEQLN